MRKQTKYRQKHGKVTVQKMLERDWVDNKGVGYDSKEKAQVASFLNVMGGGFTNGFPIAIKYFWYNAITVYPLIIFRRDSVNTQRLVHEVIHIRQQRELLIVGAYVWYFVELVIRFIMYRGDLFTAYKMLSMEREASENQSNYKYHLTRKPYSFINYLK